MTEWEVTVKITAALAFTEITGATLFIQPANCAQSGLSHCDWDVELECA